MSFLTSQCPPVQDGGRGGDIFFGLFTPQAPVQPRWFDQIPARGDHRRIVKVFDDSTAGYEIPWEGDPALLASQLTEQEALNEPSLEKESTEYSAMLGTSTGSRARETVRPLKTAGAGRGGPRSLGLSAPG